MDTKLTGPGDAGRYPTDMPITSAFNAAAFGMKSLNDLDAADFARHPIWSEYYDYTERKEILDWGVSPQCLDELLARHHNGNVHAVYTVLNPHPLPDRMRLYIRSRFTTANGDSFDGYVVNDDAYCYSIFVGDDEFTFGRTGMLDDFSAKALAKLRVALNEPNFQLLPLHYETDVLDDSDQLIAGVIPDGG